MPHFPGSSQLDADHKQRVLSKMLQAFHRFVIDSGQWVHTTTEYTSVTLSQWWVLYFSLESLICIIGIFFKTGVILNIEKGGGGDEGGQD